MEGADTILSIVGGIVLRFGIPILVTGLAVWLLRRLDTRWTRDAEEQGLIRVTAKNPGCWEVHNCSEEKRSKCKAFQNQDVPCWHLLRDNSGNLQERCLGCDVFVKAPIPISS